MHLVTLRINRIDHSSREENGLQFLFLLDGIPVDATRWRADMIFVLDVNFHVLLLTWNLCLSCV